MSDTIGRISILTPTASGLVFPLVTDYPFSTSQPLPTVSHRFGDAATLSWQTFAVGIGPQKFSFRRNTISRADRLALTNFYSSVQGSFQSFRYDAPQVDRSTTPYQV